MKKLNVLMALLIVVQLANFALPTGVQAAVVNDFFNPNVNGVVYATALQSNGKIIIGGSFSLVSGTTRNNIARLNPDGTLDTTFTLSLNSAVYALAVQPDDKILVGGDFVYGSHPNRRDRIIRLTPEGGPDTSFSVVKVDGPVYALALQTDGKIIIGGAFNNMGIGSSNEYTRKNIARLNANGTMDTAFNPGAVGIIRAIFVQNDGKILVGGYYDTLAGVACNHIGRLNGDGTLDTTFSASASHGVLSIALHADGRILIGGIFSKVNDVTRGGIARLNRNGSLDTTLAPALGRNDVKTIVIQPDGKILFGGWFSTVNGQTRTMLARLNFDGSLDAGFAPAFKQSNEWVNTLTLQPDGKILVGGSFTLVGNSSPAYLARLYPDGSKEIFAVPAIDYKVSAIAVHHNGGILIGGDFTEVGGVSHQGIARIRPNGQTDHSFDAAVAVPGYVYALAVQSDGKVLVGGSFTNLNGELRNNFGRLNANGTLDTDFSGDVNGPVYAIALQKDGKILIGGDFTLVGSTLRRYVARLNTNGTLDTSFDPPEVGGVVRAIGLHYYPPDYNQLVLIGGDFTYVGGSVRNRLARLGTNGALDTSFSPSAGGIVRSLLVQPDGKILVAGDFTSLVSKDVNRIGRLNDNGSWDTTFAFGLSTGANGTINTMALQADGKILVGGAFTQLHNVGVQRVGRLHADGYWDTNFLPGDTGGTGTAVLALAIQPDGKVLAGGSFTILDGSSVSFFGRIATDEPAFQQLNIDEGRTEVWWTIKGPMPDFYRVAIEYGTDGVNFTHFNHAIKAAGTDNWRLPIASLPTGNVFLRAKGYASSGAGNGSVGLIQSVVNIYSPTGETDPPDPGNTYQMFLPLITR